jgi:hypothetical protein
MRRLEGRHALIAFLDTLTGDNAKKLKAETRVESIDQKIPETDPASQIQAVAHTPSTENKVGLQPTARIFP